MITRATLSSVVQGLPKYRSVLAGNAPYIPPSFESIATFTTSGVATMTFSSIPSTYKHLQVRINYRTDYAGEPAYILINSDTGNNYSRHAIEGTGSAVYARGAATQNSALLVDNNITGPVGTPYSNSAIVDLIDYASTTKKKTIRMLFGGDANGTGTVQFNSFLWNSTSAVNAITFYQGSGLNWPAGISFSLYGITG